MIRVKHREGPPTEQGEAVPEAGQFEYMGLIWDLVWLLRTRLGIAWRTSGLHGKSAVKVLYKGSSLPMPS